MANPLDSFVNAKAGGDLRLPPLPNLAHLIATSGGLMPGAVAFGEQMEEWRKTVERDLRQTVASTPASTTATTTTTPASTVPTTPTASGSSSAGVPAQLSTLQAELNAHIAATVVHGTASNVVGESDEGILEGKTIGFEQPRNGKFKHLMQVSQIDEGESLTIPTGYNMVVAGPFLVFGEMIVEGAFASVPG